MHKKQMESIIITNPDGSTTETTTTDNPDGSTTTTTTTSGDGFSSTDSTTFHPNGDISTTSSQTETGSDGVTTTNTITNDADGSFTNTTTVTNPDGSSTTDSQSFGSDGSSSTTFSETNADGSSSSTTTTTDSQNNTTTVETTVTNNPDGSQTTTTTTDPNGNQTTTTTTTDPSDGGSTGDPHIRTFDDLRYDFHAAGEFTLVESTEDNFQVQVRAEHFHNGTTYNTAVATVVDGHKVGIYAKGDTLVIDGSVTELNPGESLQLGNSLIARNDDTYTVTADPENSSNLDRLVVDLVNNHHLDVNVTLSPDRYDSVVGLLGNNNGVPDDDFILQNGTFISQPGVDFERIYTDFSESWRISQEESLFDYAPGEDTSTFTELNFFDNDNVIVGLAGDDTINGGAGNDVIDGRRGADFLDGGDGVDTLRYLKSNAGVTIDLSRSIASGGAAEGDAISNFENVHGSKHDDDIRGDRQNNLLKGFDGNDRLVGKIGDDSLIGGAGNDRLLGQKGDDVLIGVDEKEKSLASPGAGERDVLIGGDGADEFVLGNKAGSFYYDDATTIAEGRVGRAVLRDFTPGEDQIILHGSAANYELRETQAGHTVIFETTGSVRDMIAFVPNTAGLDLSDSNTFAFAS